MRVGLEVDKSGRKKCRYHECDKDPQYVGENGKIKKGTTCATITVYGAGGTEPGILGYYCRGCIDKIYAELKKILNSNLWVFH
jgi:hypothetical protein